MQLRNFCESSLRPMLRRIVWALGVILIVVSGWAQPEHPITGANAGQLESVALIQTQGIPVFKLRFSPDGAEIYGAHGSNVTVWDVESRAVLRSWFAHSGYAAGIDVSPDGTLVATAGADETVRVWSAGTGTLVQELAPGGTDAVAFSPDGAHLVSPDHEGGMWIWSTGSWEIEQTVAMPNGAFSCAFSPDSDVVVTAHGLPRFAVRAWSVSTGELLWENYDHTGDAHKAAFSPDGELVVSIGADRLVLAHEAETGAERRTIRGHTQPLFALTFVEDGMVATGDGSGQIILWNPSTGRMYKRLSEHRSQVTGLAVSPDGTLMASSSFDMEIMLWEVPRD